MASASSTTAPQQQQQHQFPSTKVLAAAASNGKSFYRSTGLLSPSETTYYGGSAEALSTHGVIPCCRSSEALNAALHSYYRSSQGLAVSFVRGDPCPTARGDPCPTARGDPCPTANGGAGVRFLDA